MIPPPTFLEPWTPIASKSEAALMLRELRVEAGWEHPLSADNVVAVARGMGDDVLYRLPEPPGKLVCVHLTFSGHPEPDLCEIYYEDWEDFITRRMLPDHSGLLC